MKELFMVTLESIKDKFRRGHRAEAIKDCTAVVEGDPGNVEALRLCSIMNGMEGNFDAASAMLRRLVEIRPDDPEARFNLAVAERERNQLGSAVESYQQCLQIDPKSWEAWANLAECQFLLGRVAEAFQSAERALLHNKSASPAWITKGDCHGAQNRHAEALACYARAHSIAPTPDSTLKQATALSALGRVDEAMAGFEQAMQSGSTQLAARKGRANLLARLGRLAESIDDYYFVLERNPDDDEALRNACIGLQQIGRFEDILQLCQNVLGRSPSSVSAKIARSWALGKMVPPWHVPMMNEFPRNNSYFRGIETADLKDRIVLEIGAGSGLLSMMAAKAGAKEVVGCEAVPQIAEVARSVITKNGYDDTVSIVGKPSFAVQLGKDLSERADVLIHEIFSNELLSEHVIPAIEDAKARLLKPGATMLPASASVMGALVGGELLGQYLSAGESFGFDLSDFNRIAPKKIPLSRPDLKPELLSDAVDVFRFDFQNVAAFPPEYKTLDLEVTGDGLCFGLIQWIRIEMNEAIHYENHPAKLEPVTNWQQVVYRFDTPLVLAKGQVVRIEAAHDRLTLWFDLCGLAGA